MLPGLGRARASSEAVAAAGELLDALTDNGTGIRNFRGPEGLFAGQVLRAQVLGTELPDRGEFCAASDYLTRRAAAAPVPAKTNQHFIDKVHLLVFCCQSSLAL